MKRILLVPAFMLLLSCRSLVLENRSVCPALIYLDVEDTGGMGKSELLHVELRDDSGRIMASDSVSIHAMDREDYCLSVSKSDEVVASGVFTAPGCRRDGTLCMIPEGSDACPLWRFRANAPGMEEEIHIPVRLTKEHSLFTVRFIAEDDVFPYYVTVTSSTAGLDVDSGHPVKGSFSYTPPERSPGEFIFTVPRQGDNSLCLEIYTRDPADGGHVDDLLLCSLLDMVKGFSWEMENLPDIILDIDYARSKVTVTVSDWESGETYDYII